MFAIFYILKNLAKEKAANRNVIIRASRLNKLDEKLNYYMQKLIDNVYRKHSNKSSINLINIVYIIDKQRKQNKDSMLYNSVYGESQLQYINRNITETKILIKDIRNKII